MKWLALFTLFRAVAAPVSWDYVVKEVGESLSIEAKFPGRCPAKLVAEPGSQRFVRDLKKKAAGGACAVSYRFALGDAARAMGEVWLAAKADGLTYAASANYLVRPVGDFDGVRIKFRVEPREGFVTGIFPGKEKNTYEVALDDLEDAPYTVFGPLRTRTIPLDGGEVVVAFAPGRFGMSDDDLVDWIGQGARAVQAYFGKFPTPHALVLLRPTFGRGLEEAKTYGDGGSLITLQVGRHAVKERLMKGWVLPHEMVHLSFPEIPYRHHWVHEGLATYVEPLARLKIGNISVDEVWGDLVDGLPKGVPGFDDRGLDGTDEWGRLYWGGALYWLLVDVEIHKRSNNKLGLEDALRAITKAGGNNSVAWPLTKALAIGDRAIGMNVLTEYYDKMKNEPYRTDLDKLFKDLGVKIDDGRVKFDDTAPLAGVRKAIAVAPRLLASPNR